MDSNCATRTYGSVQAKKKVSTPIDMMTLDSKKELAVLTCACALGILALFLAHTVYVTASTYWYGLILAAALISSFWTRLRKRALPMPRWLLVTSNVSLGLLSLAALIYLMGIATWYK